MTQIEYLKDLFFKFLETEIAILRFQKSISKRGKDRKGLDEMIKNGEKAIKTIRDLKHIEILTSLYNSFLAQKETYFITLERVINSENTEKWDKTEDGFKEFLELEESARAKSREEYEEKKKQAELIAQARKDGKKVEMILEDGKLKPIIVEDNHA